MLSRTRRAILRRGLLRAVHGVHLISGIHSLISVYLIALFLLNVFLHSVRVLISLLTPPLSETQQSKRTEPQWARDLLHVLPGTMFSLNL